jgi:uncharacterized SAM-binding protein YcdF (DUF218 family)
VFWLKKLVGSLLMPLPLCLALLAAGFLLSRGGRHPVLGRRLLTLAAVLLLVFSNRYISTCLLRPLEQHYPAIPEMGPWAPVQKSVAGCAYVVVLGGGHSDMSGVAATGRLSTSALARIVEAVRILGNVPAARLIVSGPGEPGRQTHASVLAHAAESLGVRHDRIVLIDTARDTEDESFAVARLVSGQRIALVTSAWHMPRAAHLFTKAGVDFVACPADFVARDNIHLGWSILGWDSESLERSTLAVHERIGLLWLRLRGA